MAPPEWELGHCGDLDGDGTFDLLWQHRTLARLAVCPMLDGVQGSCTELAGPSNDSNWRIRVVADLDGDWNADIVWQHVSDNRVIVWSMHAAEILRPIEVADLGGTNWNVAGAGRFIRADARSLLLWNSATNAVAVSMPKASGAPLVLGTNSPGFEPVAIDDLDLNGLDDIVWQTQYTATSPVETKVWLSSEDGRPHVTDFPDLLPEGWHIVTAARF